MGTEVWFYKQSNYLYPSHIGIHYSELEVPHLWPGLLAECQWGWGSTCLSFSSARSSQMCLLQHWREVLLPCLVDSFAKYITSPITVMFAPRCLSVVSISWLAINIHCSGKEGEGSWEDPVLLSALSGSDKDLEMAVAWRNGGRFPRWPLCSPSSGRLHPRFMDVTWRNSDANPMWNPSTSSSISVWIWFWVLLMTVDLIKQSLHCNQLQLDPNISGKPQFPWCPFVLSALDCFPEHSLWSW